MGIRQRQYVGCLEVHLSLVIRDEFESLNDSLSTNMAADHPPELVAVLLATSIRLPDDEQPIAGIRDSEPVKCVDEEFDTLVGLNVAKE